MIDSSLPKLKFPAYGMMGGGTNHLNN